MFAIDGVSCLQRQQGESGTRSESPWAGKIEGQVRKMLARHPGARCPRGRAGSEQRNNCISERSRRMRLSCAVASKITRGSARAKDPIRKSNR